MPIISIGSDAEFMRKENASARLVDAVFSNHTRLLVISEVAGSVRWQAATKDCNTQEFASGAEHTHWVPVKEHG